MVKSLSVFAWIARRSCELLEPTMSQPNLARELFDLLRPQRLLLINQCNTDHGGLRPFIHLLNTSHFFSLLTREACLSALKSYTFSVTSRGWSLWQRWPRSFPVSSAISLYCPLDEKRFYSPPTILQSTLFALSDGNHLADSGHLHNLRLVGWIPFSSPVDWLAVLIV